MSNIAQTITIIAATIALIGIVVGLQSWWISRSLDRFEAGLVDLRASTETGLREVRASIDDVKTEIVRDHGERIARLEERLR